MSLSNPDVLINPTSDNHSIWLDAKWFNKAYRMGLLDPETFTQKYDAALEKYNGLRILCPLLNWTTYPANAEFTK